MARRPAVPTRVLRLVLLAAALGAGSAEAADAGDPGVPRASAGPADERDGAPVFLRRRWVEGTKIATAWAGTALLVWGAVLRRRGTPEVQRRPRDVALLSLGLLGGLCGWNLFQFHYPAYAHPTDSYHYYFGAKYFPELGYTRLYACTAVADLEAGRRSEASPGRIRDLATNRLASAAPILAEPERCTRHFTPARWEAFARDLAWLRERVSPRRWARMQMDHGYNGTPAWGILGRALTSTGPLGLGQWRALTWIDPALLLGLWGCVAWAFGWRALCVALLFWGTSYFAPYGWTGGGILRQDWLVASGIGLCLLRRDRPLAAGACLGYAALSRVFPAVMFAGVALGVAGGAWRARRLRITAAQRRLAAGALLSAAVLLPLSALSSGAPGLSAWSSFAANSRVLLGTPLENHMGLRTVVAHDPSAVSRLTRDASAEDPHAAWKAGRAERFQARRPLFVALVLAFVLLLARAAADRPDWVAAVLGIGLVPVALELTCYYFALLFGFALLWTRREGVGAALVGLSAVSWVIADTWLYYDEIFTWISATCVAFSVYATAAVGAQERRVTRA